MINAVNNTNEITTDMIIEAAQEYGLSETLVNAVIEQLGSEDEDLYFELKNVAGHGANIGIGGFIYSAECYEFWNKNRRAIRNLLKDTAESLGEDLLTMVQNFNHIKGDYNIDEIGEAIYTSDKEEGYTSIYDVLAWFALEEVARAVVDNIEIDN